MGKYLKYTIPPSIVAVVIFYLCCLIPPSDIPEIGYEFLIPTDKIVHFLMYFGLSMVASFMYIHENNGHIIILKMILFAILLPILYGGFIEIVQHRYFPDRTGDWLDFMADALGSLAALPIALTLRRWYLNKQLYEL